MNEDQMDLRLGPIETKNVPKGRIDRAAEAFHKDNPHVYENLATLARQAKRMGFRRMGIKRLWEILRWNYSVATNDRRTGYKLSNNYHSRYSRWLMEREPDLRGFFVTRKLRSV